MSARRIRREEEHVPRQYCPRCAAEVPVDDDTCFFGHDVTGTEAEAPEPRPPLGGSGQDERSGPFEDLAGAVAAGDLEPAAALAEVAREEEATFENREPQKEESQPTERTAAEGGHRDRVEVGAEADPDRVTEEAELPTDGGSSIDPNALTARSRKRKRGLLSRLFS